MVTPSIYPWLHDSLAVCPGPNATTCVDTHVLASRRNFSTRQCSASHGIGVTRLSLHFYFPSLTCLIPRFVSNRPYLGYFERRVGHRTSLNEVEAKRQQTWNEMSQNIIQNLYASMLDRKASCIRPRRGSKGIKSSTRLPFSLK
ncbi:uncharacterized protein TNCV_2234271 [Trichonephila clavipes]|nr:uncharacterized protein TNCV_2234271 [Trichonephila clavipes]